jgi:hypothetical protein
VDRNGLLNGLETHWNKDGSKSSEIRFLNDKKHGTATQWWPDGQKRSVIKYRDDYEIDTAYEWHANGRLHTKSVHYGQYLKEFTRWDKEGKVESHKSTPEQYFMPPHLFNQTAKFITEGPNSYRPGGDIESWFWYIDGQLLTWNSDTVRIPHTSSGVHTIVFYPKKGKPSDTVYCHISEPNTFKIYWNPCCDSYNISPIYRSSERNDRSGKAVKLFVKGMLDCDL